ncbi:hypothetical protein FHT00_001841 [Sphingomonas insulae]|nr:hypothetical protein [Sphingomonas insulae]
MAIFVREEVRGRRRSGRPRGPLLPDPTTVKEKVMKPT